MADGSINAYLSVSGADETEELTSLYQRMEEAMAAWDNDFDLETLIRRQLVEFLPVISGTRMFQDYLDYLFPVEYTIDKSGIRLFLIKELNGKNYQN